MTVVRRLVRSPLFGFRDLTSRIRSPLVWRALYGLLGSRLFVAAAAKIAQISGGLLWLPPSEVVERGSHLFLTGWPHHRGTPWVNLHVSRFTSDVKRSLTGGRPVPPRRPRMSRHLRVGLLANLGSTLTFSPPFFHCIPDDVDLVVFDVGGRSRTSGYLEEIVAAYRSYDPVETAAIVEGIEDSDLDLLLFDIYKADIYGILDACTVPCPVDVCTTVKLVFHPNVAFHLYCLQQADYLPERRSLFCATSETLLRPGRIVPGALLFDGRDFDPEGRKPWLARDPLLVYHGKLYKASGPYLDAVMTLLADDSQLEFVFMGRDSDGALERVRSTARTYGVESRIHYEGEFRLVRDAEGRVQDPSWLRLADLLRRARLAPDPWPLGGAYSRVEAYAAGAPVVHLGIRADPASWRRPQHAVTADHPALTIERMTAFSPAEYIELAQQALHDERFADSVADEQARRARELTDGAAFWRQIRARYDEWLSARVGSTPARSDLGLRTQRSIPAAPSS